MEGIASLPEAVLSKEGTPKGAAKEMDTNILFVFEVLGSGLATLCTLPSQEGEMN